MPVDRAGTVVTLEVSVEPLSVVIVGGVVFFAGHDHVFHGRSASVFPGDQMVGLPGVGGARASGPGADGVVEDHRDALFLRRQARVVHRE